jgi:cell wall-associated NlpC family hydrolase
MGVVIRIWTLRIRVVPVAVAAILAGTAVAVSAAPLTHSTTTTPKYTYVAETDLNGRDGPSLNANVVKVNMYLSGHPVSLSCQARGEEAYGSAIWDRTTDGVWVPDHYVKTGATGYAPGVPRCNDTSDDVHQLTATANLDGRQSPFLSAVVAQTDEYPAKAEVPVVCQAAGGSAYGSTVWDKTSDGVWVPDAYVKTGYTGFDPQIPRCTTTSVATKYGYVATTDLNGRKITSVSAAAVKVYKSGSTVYVTCQAIGDNAYGSNIWDKTTDGLWVADHYVKTGYDTFVPGLPRCAGSTGTKTSAGSGYVAETSLDGRSAKKLSAAAVHTYAAGSTIKIVCQAYGAYAYGSYIWDKTADGAWVTDHYVKTGSDGFISNMPRCDNDPPSGGPGTGGGGSGGSCATGHGRNSGPAGSTSGTSAQKVQRVIALAEAETGKDLSYSWGAGGKGGPDCGIASLSPGGCNDYDRFGFDRSGMTEYVFWAATGVDIGDNSDAQSPHGTVVSYSDIRPGDLLF